MPVVAPPSVSSFDPDAPDPGGWGLDVEWADGHPPARGEDGAADVAEHTGVVPDDVWVDPFDEVAGPEDAWVDPLDAEPALDTPAARADWAYGRAVEPATPTSVLERVVDDLSTWDVDALAAEMHDGLGEAPDPRPGDRPDVLVLRRLLSHPNRPDDLAARLVAGWLEDPARDPWLLLVALASDEPVPPDDLVTVVTEACDAARVDAPPAWSMLATALAWGRADGDAVRDLLALVPFPLDQPARAWPDALKEAGGLPGGVKATAGAAGEALGWDGRRLPGLPAAVVTSLQEADRRARADSFADQLELCRHGPVVLTPTGVSAPSHARGEKAYVALLVGSHPVFRLKRDWPDRSDQGGATGWSWTGAQVLETRGLGCDACREEPDRGKALFVTDGSHVARVRAARVQAVVERLEDEAQRRDAGD